MFDEVLVRGSWVERRYEPQPIAPGIPPALVENMLVLDYAAPESLEILRAHAHEIAAVLVEPVQSRQPDLQPREFMHELRAITDASRRGADLRRGRHRLPLPSGRRAGVLRRRRPTWRPTAR